MIETTPPSSSYEIEHLQHWSAQVCGASSVDIRVYIKDVGWSNWYTSLTVNTSECPEYGDDHGWCQ